MAVPIVEATMALRNCASCSDADKLPYVAVVMTYPRRFLVGLDLQEDNTRQQLFNCINDSERRRAYSGHALLHRTKSAFGPKRTSVFAAHMSAFGGKADIAVCRCLLLRSLLGVKRT